MLPLSVCGCSFCSVSCTIGASQTLSAAYLLNWAYWIARRASLWKTSLWLAAQLRNSLYKKRKWKKERESSLRLSGYFQWGFSTCSFGHVQSNHVVLIYFVGSIVPCWAKQRPGWTLTSVQETRETYLFKSPCVFSSQSFSSFWLVLSEAHVYVPHDFNRLVSFLTYFEPVPVATFYQKHCWLEVTM